MNVQVTLGGTGHVLPLDIIEGELPLLLGLQACEELGINASFADRRLYLGGREFATWDRGDIVRVDLGGNVHVATTSESVGLSGTTGVEGLADGDGGVAGLRPGLDPIGSDDGSDGPDVPAGHGNEDSPMLNDRQYTSLRELIQDLSDKVTGLLGGATVSASGGLAQGNYALPPADAPSGPGKELAVKLNDRRRVMGDPLLPVKVNADGSVGNGPSLSLGEGTGPLGHADHVTRADGDDKENANATHDSVGHGTGPLGHAKSVTRAALEEFASGVPDAERAEQQDEVVVELDDDDDVVDGKRKVRTGPQGKVRPSIFKKAKPRVLRLTPREVRKAHETNHASESRMLSWVKCLLDGLPKEEREHWREDEEKLVQMIKDVVAKCEACASYKKRIFAPGLTIPDVNKGYNESVFLDTMAFDKGANQHVLVCVDVASGDVALQYIGANSAESVTFGYFNRWASTRGWSDLILSDVGGDLRAKLASHVTNVAGCEKRVVAAKASEAHGRVERVIWTIRWSLERFRYTRPGYRSGAEIQAICCVIENGIRNEVLSGGYSASQRATGRNSSLDKTFMHETMVASAYETPYGLALTQQKALDAYNWVRSNRVLGEIHATKSRPQRYEELLPVGCKVDYFTTETAVRGRGAGSRRPHWKGPARLVGWVPAAGAKEHVPTSFGSGYYILEHNGTDLRRARYHVRVSELASRFNHEDEPEFASRASELAKAAIYETSSEEEIASGLVALWAKAETALLRMAKEGTMRTALDLDDSGSEVSEVDDIDWPTELLDAQASGSDATGMPFRGAAEAVPIGSGGLQKVSGPTGPGQAGGVRMKTVRGKAADGSWAQSEQLHADERDRLRRGLTSGKKLTLKDGVSYDMECKACRQRLKGGHINRKHNCGLHGASCRDALCAACHEDPEIYHTLLAEVTQYQAVCSMYQKMGLDTCLVSTEDAGLPDSVKDGAPINEYGLTWEGLPQAARDAAFAKAVNEYYKHDCWRVDIPVRELSDLKQSGIEVLTAAFRGQRAKLDPDGNPIGRVRWTPRGFEQLDILAIDACSPTVASMTLQTMEMLGIYKGFRGFQVDWESAFFQQREIGPDEPELWCMIPEGDPEWVAGKRLCRRLRKYVPGTKMAPRAWYETLIDALLGLGFVRSRIDPCLLQFRHGGECVITLPIHVDDARGRCHPEWASWLENTLNTNFSIGCFVWTDTKKEGVVFTGRRYIDQDDGSVRRHMHEYLDQKVELLPLEKEQWKRRQDSATVPEVSQFRSVLGKTAWYTQHHAQEFLYETSRLQGRVSSLEVQDLFDANKLVRSLTAKDCRYEHCLPKLRGSDEDLRITVVCDGGNGSQDAEDDKKAQSGYFIALTSAVGSECGVVYVRSGRAKRVTHDSFDIETITGVEAVDAGLACAALVEEFLAGPMPSMKTRALVGWLQSEEGLQRPKVPLRVYTDCNSLTVNVRAPKTVRKLSRRRAVDVADLRECVSLGDIELLESINGPTNPTDCLTKVLAKTHQTRVTLREIFATGHYAPDLQ